MYQIIETSKFGEGMHLWQPISLLLQQDSFTSSEDWITTALHSVLLPAGLDSFILRLEKQALPDHMAAQHALLDECFRAIKSQVGARFLRLWPPDVPLPDKDTVQMPDSVLKYRLWTHLSAVAARHVRKAASEPDLVISATLLRLLEPIRPQLSDTSTFAQFEQAACLVCSKETYRSREAFVDLGRHASALILRPITSLTLAKREIHLITHGCDAAVIAVIRELVHRLVFVNGQALILQEEHVKNQAKGSEPKESFIRLDRLRISIGETRPTFDGVRTASLAHDIVRTSRAKLTQLRALSRTGVSSPTRSPRSRPDLGSPRLSNDLSQKLKAKLRSPKSGLRTLSDLLDHAEHELSQKDLLDVRIVLLPDLQLTNCIRSTDKPKMADASTLFLLVGAAEIKKDTFDIVTTAGTSTLASLVREKGGRVLVAAKTDVVASSHTRPVSLEGPTNMTEAWQGMPGVDDEFLRALGSDDPLVSTTAHTYEVLPFSSVDAVITENGISDKAHIARLSKERTEAEEAVFGHFWSS